MEEEPDTTSDAAQSAAQSRTPDHAEESVGPVRGEGRLFEIGKRLRSLHVTRSYRRARSDPLYRPLSIFALDPSVSKLKGAVAKVDLPYEPLAPGPEGTVVTVDNVDATGTRYVRADLDKPEVLITGGYPPSISRPEFHQQMVYAVAMMTYHRFRLALGRDISWAFAGESEGHTRLKLRPFGKQEANAWYDRHAGEIVFGYFTPTKDTPVSQAEEGLVYTSLSHDIIVHEVSHALLDGLRAHFLEPTHPDVPAFHEAFSDLVALFEHFTHGEAVRSALAEHRGDLTSASTLISLAGEFGRSLGLESGTLRTFAELETELDGSHLTYNESDTAPHERGKVLARAVFDAFAEIYRRRTRRYIKLATGERGLLPEGDLPETLEDLLVEEVQKVAQQFATICIRAIDYLPPVDIRFGDYLRAMITADRDLVPDDPLGYRETLIRSFGRRGIYGTGTWEMTEDALAWNQPRMPLWLKGRVQLARFAVSGGFAEPANAETLGELAESIGRLVADPSAAREFGLVSPVEPRFDEGYSLPTIESIRIARRAGPDKQITFDLVAEITQERQVEREGTSFAFFGGATLIIDSFGELRFSIRKRVDHEGRESEQWGWMRGTWGARFWDQHGSSYHRAHAIARRLCDRGGKGGEGA